MKKITRIVATMALSASGVMAESKQEVESDKNESSVFASPEVNAPLTQNNISHEFKIEQVKEEIESELKLRFMCKGLSSEELVNQFAVNIESQ